MKWRNFKDEKPKDGQELLAKFKHGIIDCVYDLENEVGRTYIWSDIEFYIYEWMPMEEFNNAIKGQSNE